MAPVFQISEDPSPWCKIERSNYPLSDIKELSETASKAVMDMNTNKIGIKNIVHNFITWSCIFTKWDYWQRFRLSNSNDQNETVLMLRRLRCTLQVNKQQLISHRIPSIRCKSQWVVSEYMGGFMGLAMFFVVAYLTGELLQENTTSISRLGRTEI